MPDVRWHAGDQRAMQLRVLRLVDFLLVVQWPTEAVHLNLQLPMEFTPFAQSQEAKEVFGRPLA